MKLYEVSAGHVFLPPGGTIELTDAQADARAHQLQPTEVKGQYLITAATGFKKGEVFSYDGHLDKTTAMALFDESGKVAEPILPEPEQPEAEVTETPQGQSFSKTVAELATQLKTEVPDTLELLKEYGVEAQDENAVVPQHVFIQVVADKAAEVD